MNCGAPSCRQKVNVRGELIWMRRRTKYHDRWVFNSLRSPFRFLAKKENPKRFEGLLPASQGQNLAFIVLHVPYSLDSGAGQLLHRNVQRFRGGLVFKAHRLCVSLNPRLESNT